MLLTMRAPAPAGAAPDGESALLGRPMLGTLVETEAYHPDRALARAALRAGFDRIDDVDRLMSVFREDSEISRVNRAAGTEPVPVTGDTGRVLSEARAIAVHTAGALDVTVLPLMQLWKAAVIGGRPPSPAALDRTRRGVGIATHLTLDDGGSTAFLKEPGAGIDLGGIAKGFAVDLAVEALHARGITSGIVNAGGDLRVIGRAATGGSWRVGLRHPLRPDTLLLSVLVEDEGVATSGNYIRYFEIGGRRYGHVLDPRTGTPAETALSVTVIAPSAMRADGFATGALAHGAEGALELIERAGLDGIVVTRSFRPSGSVIARVTRGLAGRVELIDSTAVISSG